MGCGASSGQESAPANVVKPAAEQKKVDNQNNSKDSKQLTPKK